MAQSSSSRNPSDPRHESPAERADRNLGELLQELRVALPGVQVLFAFLLTVPFAQGFTKIDDFQRDLYFGVLLSTALATALLIAPTANHRLLFQLRDKENLVRVSNRLAIVGLAVLAVSLTGAVLLISDILFKSPAPAIFTAVTGLVFVILWGAVPVARRMRLSQEEK
jgi:L-asparagine transporter-like permease